MLLARDLVNEPGEFAHGLGVRPFHLIEGELAVEQASSDDLLQIFTRVRGIELAIVHRFVEDPSMAGREGGFGVLNKNLTPKPAFCDLAAVRGVSVGIC